MRPPKSTTCLTPSYSISETQQEKIVQWFAFRCLKAYPQLRPWREDLLQSFRLATWLATKNYDPNKGSFSSRAIQRMKSELSKYLRVRSESRELVGHSEELFTFMSSLQSDFLSMFRGDETGVFVFLLHSWAGYSFRDIAGITGISRSQVHHIFKNTEEKVRAISPEFVGGG